MLCSSWQICPNTTKSQSYCSGHSTDSRKMQVATWMSLWPMKFEGYSHLPVLPRVSFILINWARRTLSETAVTSKSNLEAREIAKSSFTSGKLYVWMLLDCERCEKWHTSARSWRYQSLMQMCFDSSTDLGSFFVLRKRGLFLRARRKSSFGLDSSWSGIYWACVLTKLYGTCRAREFIEEHHLNNHGLG